MGRPSASQENRQIGLLFSKAACVNGAAKAFDGMVARNGSMSVFGALSACYPSIVRDERGGPRDGLTCMELNKTLQKNGFQRKRNRRSASINRSSDRFGAGMYLFHMCRWRDPKCPEDLVEMQAGWASLVRFCPQFGNLCTFERFCEVIDHIRIQWDPWTGKKKRRNADGTAESPIGSIDDGEENDGESDDEDENQDSSRSASTIETVLREDEGPRKRSHAQMEEQHQPPHQQSHQPLPPFAFPSAPFPGSSGEMERLRQELQRTKDALAMYQLSNNNNTQSSAPPPPPPPAMPSLKGLFCFPKSEQHPATNLALPLLTKPALQNNPNNAIASLPLLQQLLQQNSAGGLMLLPQMGPQPNLNLNAGLPLASLGLGRLPLSPCLPAVSSAFQVGLHANAMTVPVGFSGSQ